MLNRGFLLIVGLCLVSPGICQEETKGTNAPQADVLTLDDAIRIALEKHPALRGAEAAVAVSEARVKQVRAGYFPQLSLSGIGKMGLSGATGALGLPGFPGSPFFRNLAYSANWYQNIFDFGRTKHRVASQESLAENARLRRLAEEDRIVLAVERAYFSVLEAQELRHLAEETVEERRLTSARVQAYFQAQLLSQLDVNLARANLAGAQGQLIEARNAVSTGFAALRAAMGVEGQAQYRLQDPKIEIPAMPPLEEHVELAFRSRPDEFAGFAAAGQGRFEGTPVKRNQRHGVGALGVIFPFFTGGRLKAREEEARAELEAASASYDFLRQHVQLEVTQAYHRVINHGERIETAAEQEQAAREALRLAQARFRQQLASFLELTTAEVALTRAETNHAQAVFEYQRARAELQFATGRTLKP
jgi:outer membrane protein TolC